MTDQLGIDKVTDAFVFAFQDSAISTYMFHCNIGVSFLLHENRIFLLFWESIYIKFKLYKTVDAVVCPILMKQT